MTVDITTAVGEEYCVTNALDGTTVTWGVYYDATDGVQDADYDPSTTITTEPTNTAYARQSVTMDAAQITTDVWGVENATSISFDFTDTESTDKVDAIFGLVNFASTHTGSTGDWLCFTVGFTDETTLGNASTIDYGIGELTVTYS